MTPEVRYQRSHRPGIDTRGLRPPRDGRAPVLSWRIRVAGYEMHVQVWHFVACCVQVDVFGSPDILKEPRHQAAGSAEGRCLRHVEVADP